MADPTKRSLADLIADLDASDAEAEAGDTVPAETVFARLQEAIDSLAADRQAAALRKAGPTR